MGIKEVAGGLPTGSALVEYVRAERIAQGLPPTPEDPVGLAIIAAAVRATIAERAA